MDAPRWIVTLAGIALIALVNSWFFGRRLPA
jgi:plastocyanin domain-containing protein